MAVARSKRKFREEHPEEARRRDREWQRRRDPEKIRFEKKRWAAANKDELNAQDRQKRRENPEAVRAAERAMRSRNPEVYRAIRRRAASKPDEKMRRMLRIRLCGAIKRSERAGSAVRDLGCTIPEFRQHIERLFAPGMSWDNWGRKGWHLDHVRPLSSFDLTDREQFLQACHYSNIQPLWASENLSKGSKVNVTT